MCTLKNFVKICKKNNFNLNKSLALNGNSFSNINNTNLGSKNLTSDLGIFLIEK